MRQVDIYINWTDVKDMGVIFGGTSLTALMTPAPVKKPVTNKSAKEHGKRVVHVGGTVKTEERDVQLTFGLHARSLAQFLMRYRAFVKVLKCGTVTLKVRITEEDSHFAETYRLEYLSCVQYSEYNGRLGKFVIKFNEPNPEDRDVECSDDIYNPTGN